MKQINISTKKHPNTYASVDDEDYRYLNQWKWYKMTKGYVARRGRDIEALPFYYMHRVIMNTPKDMSTDHINHNTLNNQKSNLRICTNSQNLCNQRPQKRKTSSKYKGVGWDKSRKKWWSKIDTNRKTISLGRHKSEVEAAIAYNEKAKELFGEFAYLNIIT